MNGRLPILFNAEAAVTPPLTGVGQYARRLLEGLSRRAEEIDLTCFARGRVIPVPDFLTPPVAHKANLLRRAARSAAYRMPFVRPLRAMLAASRVQNRFADAIYHEPNHILQPFAGRTVVTIHDLSVLHYPQFHPKLRVTYFSRHLRETLDRAARIITDSEFISSDLQTSLGVAASRIRVVPLGVASEFGPLTPDITRPLLARHGLSPGAYLLAVGTREPRKNLDRLLDAFLALPETLRSRFPLALAGPRGWRADALEQRLDALERAGQARRLDYIPDADRPAIYAGAAGLAYPSLYEGFGLPPLEAAACGVPVLTSRDSPMQETLGEAAVLVDPLDTEDIRAGLQRLLTDDELRREAVRLQPQWTARFSWEACVARTLAVYREL